MAAFLSIWLILVLCKLFYSSPQKIEGTFSQMKNLRALDNDGLS